MYDLRETISNLKTDWSTILQKINESEIDKLNAFLTKKEEAFEGDVLIFPPEPLIFNCFNFFNVQETKVVILGQDPYINEGEAMGLSFSVPNGVKMPPSLRNIFKEIRDDIGVENKNTNLTNWAKQGVLLLNTALTVTQKKSNSHAKEWSTFTDNVIKYLSDECENIVFILWGNNAKRKVDLIDQNKHCVLQGVHPSPLSASNGFFGCKHFSQANLRLVGKEPIDWST